MTFVIIDIETVENDRARELYARTTYEADRRLKDPAKIEQSIMEKRQKDMDKAPLHWWTGKVICICANVIGLEEKPKTFMGDDERELLMSFFDWLDHVWRRTHGYTLIAKSGEFFDFPFLIGRAMSCDIGIPDILRPRRSIADIDHIFSFSSQCDQRSNLNNYAFGLNIAGKTGHGSQVAGLYSQIMMGDQDKWNDIGRYCASDTDIASEILRRYLKVYITRNELEPEKIIPEAQIPF